MTETKVANERPPVPEGRFLRIGPDGTVVAVGGMDGDPVSDVSMDLDARPVLVVAEADPSRGVARSLRDVVRARGIAEVPMSSPYGDGRCRDVMDDVAAFAWDDDRFFDASEARQAMLADLACVRRREALYGRALDAGASGRPDREGLTALAGDLRAVQVAVGRAADRSTDRGCDMPALLAELRALSRRLDALATDVALLACGAPVAGNDEEARPPEATLREVGLALRDAKRASSDAERALRELDGGLGPAAAKARSGLFTRSALLAMYASMITAYVDRYARAVRVGEARAVEAAFFWLGHECGRTGHSLRPLADDLRTLATAFPRSAEAVEAPGP